jgi:hypothetical protein
MEETKKIIKFEEIYNSQKDEFEEDMQVEDVEDVQVEDVQVEEVVIRKKRVNFEEPNIKMNIQEKQKEIPRKVHKKTISYEDILTSLNMTVVDGKLQYINKNAQANMKINNKSINMHLQNKINTTSSFFIQQPQQKPLTKEQYQQLVIENRKKQWEKQQRINQIKSTKMMFSNNNNQTISVSSNPNNLNKLFYFRR